MILMKKVIKMRKKDDKLKDSFLLEKDTKAKRTRKKKRTKAQEEKRTKLLKHILNKWVCVKQVYGEEETYLFLLHKSSDDNSTSKIEQIILSGDPLHDGVYLITDYDIDMVFDNKTKREMIELRPKKFDLKAGKFAEEIITNTYDDLKSHLVGAKYLTEEEFFIYCQSTNKPPGVQEMLLEYEYFSQDKEM